ncbi:MAG: TrmH family RNA methyltransferase [Pyrinomonadaceae bacterium]
MSRDNALVRKARAVRDGKQRELIFVEGVRLCEEALHARLFIEDALCTERVAQDEGCAPLLQALRDAGVFVRLASERVMDFICDTKTPQGIALLAHRPAARAAAFEKALHNSLFVILHRLNNPANAGSILRTAEAAGANGVIATAGSTDMFSPKALRGAMGSSFRLPLWTGAGFSEAIEWCRARDIKTVATDARATRLYSDIDWTKPKALLVGAEAGGLTEDETAACDEVIHIPMRAPVESLNVGVAAAIVLYEAARQRSNFPSS